MLGTDGANREPPTLARRFPVVPGARLYPLVPPLPVLLESVTSGPPPFRGKTECIPRAVDDGKYGNLHPLFNK